MHIVAGVASNLTRLRINYSLDQEFTCIDEDQIRGYSCFSDESYFEFSHCCAHKSVEPDNDTLIIVLSVIGGISVIIVLVILGKWLLERSFKENVEEKDAVEPGEEENLNQ